MPLDNACDILLGELTSRCGLSGYTSDIGRFILERAKTLGIVSGIDTFGSISALVRPRYLPTKRKRVMLSAHLDSCGYLVGGFGKSSGEVLLQRVGSPLFVGNFLGTVFAKDKLVPIKVEEEGEDEDLVYLDEVYNDLVTGWVSEEDCQYINVGDPVQYNSPIKIKAGKYKGAFLDNKAGVVVLLQVMEKLSMNNKLGDDFYCVFTELEEVDSCAGFSAAAKIKPHIYICIDIHSHKNKKSVGNKVVINKGPVYNKVLVDLAIKTAQEEKIPHEIKIIPGEAISDVAGVSRAAGGIPCVEFGIPGFDLHTPDEIISRRGLKNTIKLIYQYCLNLEKVESLLPIQD